MFEKIFTRNPRLARLALRSLVSGTLGRAAGGACGHRVYIFSSRAPGSFQPAPACDCMPVQGEVFPGRTPQDSAYSPTPHPIGWVARVWWPCGFHPRCFLSKVDLLAPGFARHAPPYDRSRGPVRGPALSSTQGRNIVSRAPKNMPLENQA